MKSSPGSVHKFKPTIIHAYVYTAYIHPPPSEKNKAILDDRAKTVGTIRASSEHIHQSSSYHNLRVTHDSTAQTRFPEITRA
jgi:hypothetical protein